MMEFTLLMSLYVNDNPDFFEQALQSLTQCSHKPSECVLVLDGAVTDRQLSLISKYREALNITTLPLPYNVGLGRALNAGLRLCKTEWVARFDSDDICHPDRFFIQTDFISRNPDLSIVSGLIAEFIDIPTKTHAVRRVPLAHHDIITSGKKRCPFNHVAVMYKKSAVERAGGYQDHYLFEDYALWARMLVNGERAANINEVLVYVRTGNGMAARRGGMKYALSEIAVQCQFCAMGFISFLEFARNILFRLPMRIAPVWARKLAYDTILRT